MGLGAFAASELDKVFSGYQPNALYSPYHTSFRELYTINSYVNSEYVDRILNPIVPRMLMSCKLKSPLLQHFTCCFKSERRI